MTETKIIGLPGDGRWVLVNSGMGGFLNPPGDAEHSWSVAEYRGSRSSNYESMMSLRGALDCDWVPSEVQCVARQKIAEASPQCTEEWLQSVYRHFRNCYSPDGENRNAGDCIVYTMNPRHAHETNNAQPYERSLAVLFVQKFFPDHEARMDLINGEES